MINITGVQKFQNKVKDSFIKSLQKQIKDEDKLFEEERTFEVRHEKTKHYQNK